MIKSKNAQITMFIIIGIIIIFTAFFFLFNRESQFDSRDEVVTAVSEVPLEFAPIKDFVESCIRSVGKQGVNILGSHGGYVDLNKYGIRASGERTTDENAFLFSDRDKNSGVAYWNYFKSDNRCESGCSCGSERPFLRKSSGNPNIETQIEQYINENLETCLLDFESFRQSGFSVAEIGDVKTTVNIRDSDVLVYVNYLIEAGYGDSKYEINEFLTILDVNLAKIHDLATQITRSEVNHTYIERWTLEQLAGLGLGLDSERLPPFAASELNPLEKPTYWIKSDVKENIRNNMLPHYTPFLTVFNTKNYNYDLIGTFYERASLPIPSPDNLDYSDLEVKFNYYSWWPIYFDLTGRGVTDGRIGPETMSSSFFNFVGIKRYNFYYDISYPVLVDIYDENAFLGEGLHFYIGLEANVRNNLPINCSGPGLTQYALPEASMLCDRKQACTNVTIETIDAITKEPVSGVTVFYSAGTESCDVGFSETIGDYALLKTQLPSCVGSACSVMAVKEKYYFEPKPLAVRCDYFGEKCQYEDVLCNNEKLQLALTPLSDNGIIVMKKRMLKKGKKQWEFDNTQVELSDNEFAVVLLEKIKENEFEEDLVIAYVYRSNETSLKPYPGLLPGRYRATIDLIYEVPSSQNNGVITFNSVEECDRFDRNCVTIGPFEFDDTFVEGGFIGEIVITSEILNKGDDLLLYAISVPDIDSSYSVIDAYDVEEISKISEYSEKYKDKLKPDAR